MRTAPLRGADGPMAGGQGRASFGLIARYLGGVAIAVLAVISQYFVPQLWPASRVVYGNLWWDLVIVYGLPVVGFLLLVGLDPLRQWKQNLRSASLLGLGWYGALSLLAVLVLIVLAIAYAALDPGALKLLERENPAIRSASSDPWLYIGLSFLVGAAEETIFRGWIFGTWVRRSTGWVLPAVVTSALFAGVHLYYFTTFGAASPFYYQQLFLLGFAFAATYRASGGNLLVPAALHGLNDAIAFVAILSSGAEVAAHYLFIVGAALVGLAYWLSTSSAKPAPPIGPPAV